MPQAGTLERPQKLGSQGEAPVISEALRRAVSAIAALLVPDSQERAQLLGGALPVCLAVVGSHVASILARMHLHACLARDTDAWWLHRR